MVGYVTSMSSINKGCIINNWPTQGSNGLLEKLSVAQLVKKYFEFNATRYFISLEMKNQLDATEWFIALIICPTCFGHFYVHHQELETICLLLLPMVCDSLVAGCRRSCAEQPAMCPGWGMLLEQNSSTRTYSPLLCTWLQQPANKATHAIGGNNTHIVSSSWWWA